MLHSYVGRKVIIHKLIVNKMDIFQLMKIDDVIQLTACDDALPIQFYLKTSVIGLLFIAFDYNGVI